jgi:transmembrane sensor
MSIASKDRALDEALLWAARIQDPEFDDWNGHATWLDADPAHPVLYRRAALAIEDGLAAVAQTPAATAATNDNRKAAGNPWHRPGRWALLVGGAIAASIAALVMLPHAARTEQVLVQTAAGQKRDVRLPDGTMIALNGASRIRYARSHPRHLLLDEGEAYLAVVHDDHDPLELSVGGHIFRDVGTTFDVVRSDGVTRLSVGEGAVTFDPDGAGTLLRRGKAIVIDADKAVLSTIAPASVGSWRSGRLLYQDAPLSRIAADVSRAWGVPISVAPGVAGRHFSGAIILPRGDGPALRRFAAILQLDAVPQGKGWQIAPAGESNTR